MTGDDDGGIQHKRGHQEGIFYDGRGNLTAAARHDGAPYDPNNEPPGHPAAGVDGAEVPRVDLPTANPFPANPDAVDIDRWRSGCFVLNASEADLLGQLLRGLMERLVAYPPLMAGNLVHVLAFKLGVSRFNTQAELAASLNISPGRVSQILSEIPKEFASIARLKHRAAQKTLKLAP